MPKSWYSVKAKSDSAPAEISIFDEIGIWGVSAKQFIADLKLIDAKDITLYINSPGGNVFDGLAIYNALRQKGAKVTCKVLGVAASAASLIAMAGDKIVMPENTFMMVHNPMGGVYGNADDMREIADVLDKISASLVATYVARTGQDEAKVVELLAAETFMTAAEAVELGFADEMEAALKIAASFDIERLPDSVRAAFDAGHEDDAPEPVTDPAQPRELRATLDTLVTGLCAKHGLDAYTADILLNPAVNDEAGAMEAIASAKEIAAICATARMPERAAGLIRAHASLAQARKTLIDARAAADEASHTDGHIPNTNARSGQSSADIWAKVIPTRH